MFSIKQHNSCKTGIQGLVHLYLHRYNANYLGKALPPKKKQDTMSTNICMLLQSLGFPLGNRAMSKNTTI